MKILVTGGAGFIGSHLCQKLLLQGHEVYCLDNLSSGAHHNITSLLSNLKFSFIQHDVKNPIQIEVDQIYNLACPASPYWYQKDPIDTIQTCVLGAINMLELAHKTGASILQTSTSEVYGDPLVSPQSEEYWGNVNPLGPRSCYDEGKRCAESLFVNYHKKYGMQVKIARIFNTFGPNLAVDDGRVVSNFIVQALCNNDITVYGSGNQTRSFCYVDDTVRGLTALMDTNIAITSPVNIGNPEELSVTAMAKKIIQLTNSSSKIRYLDKIEDDPSQRKPNIDKAGTLLNWRPEVPIDTGLMATINYFKEKLKCQ